MAQLGNTIVNGALRVVGDVYGSLEKTVNTNMYGTCVTAANTAAKVVTGPALASLYEGATIRVKFTYANTATNPTLNVNSTGAKNIYYNGSQITTDDNIKLLKGACDFVYDGTQWHLIGSSVSDILYVTFTYNSSTRKYESDVTYAEMQAALQAGKCVLGKAGNYIYYVSNWIVDGSVRFQHIQFNYSTSIYEYYYSVTSSQILYGYETLYVPQINSYESFYEIVYDSDQNKYVLWNIVGDVYSPQNILENNHACSFYAILFGGTLNDGNYSYGNTNEYMDDAEFFYLNKIDYDPNFEYDYYGDEYQGACVLIFNNTDNSKTITLKMGLYSDDYQSYDVTVTNNSGGGGTYYGTCDTAANVAAKVVACSSFTTLQEGATIRVKFIYANTVSYQMMSPNDIYATLNVNNTGAKPIMLYGSTYASSGITGSWNAGSIITFTYNGSSWVLNDYHNNRVSYSGGTGLSTSFEDDENNIRTITFNHSSSVTAQNTQAVYPIKINSTGHITGYGSAVQPLPAAPSTNGTYILKCVVSNGTPTYSWEEMQQGSGVQF